MTDAQKKEAVEKAAAKAAEAKKAAEANWAALQATLKTPANATASFDKLFLTPTTLDAAVAAHKKAHPTVKSLITVGMARSHVKFRMVQNAFVYNVGFADLKTAGLKVQLIGRK